MSHSEPRRHFFAFLRIAAAWTSLAVAPWADAQLGSLGTQFWRSGLPGIDSPLEAGARLGASLAAGDFNCDGLDDLAIGMPFLDFGAAPDAGGLLVLFGSASGLGAAGSQFFDQVSPDLTDVPEANDRFATTLATGNFNGDECDDLAIGTPFEDIGAGLGALVDTGIVHILRGSNGGLVDALVFFQDSDLNGDVAGVAESDDRFGSSLAVADFDGDGFDDLAVGVPGEDLGGVVDAGAVNVLFGSANFLTGERDVVYFRGSGGMPGSPQTGEQVGFALAAGPLTIFAGRELAIGCPFRDEGVLSAAGEVVIVSRVGPINPIFDAIAQSSASVPGDSEAGDHFGFALAVGDFDGDGFGEVAIGVPGKGNGAPDPVDHGAVVVAEFDTINATVFSQSQLGPDAEEAFDEFGSVLAAADFNLDGFADLVIGVPGENLSTLINAGMVHVVDGAQGGLDLAGAKTWLQTLDPAEGQDQFGAAFAVGHFAGRRGNDLAIGVPGETLGAATSAGGVNLLYSITLFVDGFETGSPFAWSLVVP